MNRDIRDSALYREAEELCRVLRRPGTGSITDAAEICSAPDGRRVAFSGTIMDSLEGAPQTRICLVDLDSADTRVLTFGPNVDRSPKYSPDGHTIAFLSDRGQSGDFQLYLLELSSGVARAAPVVEGWIEYLQWSPCGERILLGVAGHGADVAGGQGAVTTKQRTRETESWMPLIETGEESCRWRRLWVYEVATNTVEEIGSRELNIWEAAWLGQHAVAAITSPGSGEGLWYAARVHALSLGSTDAREIYAPRFQVGCPAASPSGQTLALIEAICSDRWYVAGDLLLIDVPTGRVRRVDTQGVDVTATEWRSDSQLLVTGQRGFDTVVGLCDAVSGAFRVLWSGGEMTTGGMYARVAGIGEHGDCALIGESFTRAPEIAVIRRGDYSAVRSFGSGRDTHTAAVRSVERVSWQAPDGLEVQGWLLLPTAKGPHPLVMNIHGGPVWQWRPTWLGRGRSPFVLMLVRRGCAVFFPNPRGSTGRGQGFIRRVLGDMGGADTYDLLAGLDYLVSRGVADSRRLGVMGGSYGGFMTSWLITQDSRFAAAVPMAPVTNHVSEHLISNIPHFVALFLGDSYCNATAKYFERSPIMHAHKVKTPTLSICGALDRCTPPEEAIQFHNALLENGVRSVLVTYPEEGHGIRKLPAAIDFAARVVGWFEEHMPSDAAA